MNNDPTANEEELKQLQKMTAQPSAQPDEDDSIAEACSTYLRLYGTDERDGEPQSAEVAAAINALHSAIMETAEGCAKTKDKLKILELEDAQFRLFLVDHAAIFLKRCKEKAVSVRKQIRTTEALLANLKEEYDTIVTLLEHYKEYFDGMDTNVEHEDFEEEPDVAMCDFGDQATSCFMRA